jgi:putative ABC transport system permease protein
MAHPLRALVMAVRNLVRGGRRTVSTLLAMMAGLIGLTFLDGYITYSMNGLRESVIHSGTGHLQVMSSPRFLDEGDTDPFPFMLEAAPRVEAAIRAVPGVRDVVPSLSFTAVAAANGKTSTVMVAALPVAQARADLDARTIDQGADLSPASPGRILIGRGIAKKLGIAPGDPVSLFALSKGGGVNTQTYSVSGTTSTVIAAIDNVSVAMDLSDAHSLLGTDSVPQLLVFLDHTGDTGRVAAALMAAGTGSPLHGLTVRTWEQLSPYYQQANGAYQLVLAVARLIVLIVALFSISGTLSLAVMERLREVGTLRAFGTRRSRLVLMLLLEGLVLGVAGALAGAAAGGGLSGIVNLFGGITMPPQPGTTSAFRILFTPQTATFFSNAAWVLAASLVGALFPGLLASRQRIADLLRAR